MKNVRDAGGAVRVKDVGAELGLDVAVKARLGRRGRPDRLHPHPHRPPHRRRQPARLVVIEPGRVAAHGNIRLR
ncbi:hypothetical protein [Streptomyces sp. NPDC005209]|uniref:hypothetical protein n=1 Tax=Streptomyces sp. NPDC005209 TaxID=3156715 RepID=UPI0033BC08E1